MKYRIKFRIARENGKAQKFSINLEEGKHFVIGRSVPGIKDPVGTLSLRQGNLYLDDRKASEKLVVNDVIGSEFHIHDGDVLKTGGIVIEFLSVPRNERPKHAETQFLDIGGDQVTRMTRMTRVTRVTQFTPQASVASDEAPEIQATAESETPLAPVVEPAAPEQDSPADAAAAVPVQLDSMAQTQVLQRAEAAASAALGFPEGGTLLRENLKAEHVEQASCEPTPAGIDRSKSRGALSEVTAMMQWRPKGGHEGRGEIFTHLLFSFLFCGVAAGAVRLNFPPAWGAGGAAFVALMAWALAREGKSLGSVAGFSDYLRAFAALCFGMTLWGLAFRFSPYLGAAAAVAVGVSFFGIFRAWVGGDRRHVAKVAGALATIPLLVTGGLSWVQLKSGSELGERGIASLDSVEVVVEQVPAQTESQPQSSTPAVAVAPVAPVAPVASQAAVDQHQQKSQQVPQASAPVESQMVRKNSSVPDPLAAEQLFSAARAGNLKVVRGLIEKGAVDPNFTLERGSTVLMQAANHGHIKMVKYLLSKRVNVNAQDPNGTTALMWAAYRGNSEIVKLLLSKKADPQIRRDDGDTAVDIARQWKRREVIAVFEAAAQSASGRGVASEKKKESRLLPKPIKPSPPKPSKTRVRSAGPEIYPATR